MWNSLFSPQILELLQIAYTTTEAFNLNQCDIVGNNTDVIFVQIQMSLNCHLAASLHPYAHIQTHVIFMILWMNELPQYSNKLWKYSK